MLFLFMSKVYSDSSSSFIQSGSSSLLSFESQEDIEWKPLYEECKNELNQCESDFNLCQEDLTSYFECQGNLQTCNRDLQVYANKIKDLKLQVKSLNDSLNEAKLKEKEKEKEKEDGTLLDIIVSLFNLS